MTGFIESCVRLKAVLLILLAFGVFASLYALRVTALDAVPDTSDPQLIIYAKWPRSPLSLEQEVTQPIIKALLGTADIRSIRATSHMGYSFIYVILTDGAHRATVRERVAERLATLQAQLPRDAVISIGPDATSMGWIYEYALVDPERLHDARELRLLNDYQVRPALQSVPGVAEVASVGGLEKQYQLKVFPPLLAQTGISLDQVLSAIQSTTREAGGRTVEVTNRDYQIRGSLESGGVDELEAMVVGRGKDGKGILLRDIGYIQVGYDQRRGIADLDGRGEVVGGIVVMAQGGNALAVKRRLEQHLSRVRAALPQGVELVTTYDRSDLIWSTLRHFISTLFYELAVVIVVTVFFLRNARTAIAPVAILLSGVVLTAIPLCLTHQTINLFSLAGLFIAIGEMVDATIVIVENCTAELAANPGGDEAERQRIIVRSITNVARPLIFSLLIILASFLPVFFLDPKQARLFDPLAYSKTYAMAFSTLLTLCVLPAMTVWALRRPRAAPSHSRMPSFIAIYSRAVRAAIRFRYPFVTGSLVLLVLAALLLPRFPHDVMPQIEEGSILYMPTTLPGIPAREAGWVLQRMDARLSTFPEVARVFGKLGRADSATDPAPVSMIESTILLKPASQWRKGLTKEQLIAQMDASMQILGYANSWIQPISARVMMQDTGIQTLTGIKIRGDDVAIIEKIGRQIESILRTQPGTQAVVAERISSGYYINVDLQPQRLADAGLRASEVMTVVQFGIGGDNATSVKDADRLTVPLSLQYSPEYIDTLEKVRNLPVVAPGGETFNLMDLGKVSVKQLPEMIRDESGQLAGYVYVYLNNTITPVDYVSRAQATLLQSLHLPSRYSIEWTGDYQNAAAASARLKYMIPLTLVIILLLLIIAFRSIADSLLILISVPFAFVGGVFLQWALGYPMTVAVAVGYIALFAVAIQTGIIMMIFIRQALARRRAGVPYIDAVIEGSSLRLRPKVMTVSVTVLSLLPIMLSHGPGIEIMKPIATPTIGGMLSSTLYVLFLIPALYAIGEDIRARFIRDEQPRKALHEG